MFSLHTILTHNMKVMNKRTCLEGKKAYQRRPVRKVLARSLRIIKMMMIIIINAVCGGLWSDCIKKFKNFGGYFYRCTQF